MGKVHALSKLRAPPTTINTKKNNTYACCATHGRLIPARGKKLCSITVPTLRTSWHVRNSDSSMFHFGVYGRDGSMWPGRSGSISCVGCQQLDYWPSEPAEEATSATEQRIDAKVVGHQTLKGDMTSQQTRLHPDIICTGHLLLINYIIHAGD